MSIKSVVASVAVFFDRHNLCQGVVSGQDMLPADKTAANDSKSVSLRRALPSFDGLV